MQKRLTENDLYYQILRDFQIFVQKCYEYDSPENAEEEYKRLVKPEIEKMYGKYYNTEFGDFTLDLIESHLKDMERRKDENMSNVQ